MGGILKAAAVLAATICVGALAGSAAGQAPNPAPAQPGGSPPTAAQWRDWARADVEAAYRIYSQVHPGMLDPQNRPFAQRLERARVEGLAEAERAETYADYSRALALFSAPLNDGHALAFAVQLPAEWRPPTTAEWPGFIPVWRNDALTVREADPAAGVAVGERVTACDGLPIRPFLIDRLRTRYIRQDEEGQFWDKGPQVFYAAPTSLRRPRECDFQTTSGAVARRTLAWTAAPADWNARFRAATDGDRMPIGLTEPRPGLFHIALPDFQPDDAGAALYTRLYETVDQRRAEIAAARAVVLDMRHNNGGSSGWSRRLANRLWGEAEVDAAMNAYFAGTEVWWRTVEGTSAQMQAHADLIRHRGDAAGATEQEAMAAQVSAARSRGEPFFVERFGEGRLADRVTTPRRTAFRTPVYVIVSGRCASACLDALDVFTRFDNVRLIGAPTSGDSTYMDVRSETLPSGIGRLVMPMKIWVNRPRGNGEIYRPHVVMDGLDWTTEAFLTRVEQDLATRR